MVLRTLMFMNHTGPESEFRVLAAALGGPGSVPLQGRVAEKGFSQGRWER